MTESLAEIGEFGLINRIHALIEKEGVRTRGLTLGISDDCAAFLPRQGYEILVTCDSIVEGRHYLPEFISFYDLGRRSMTLNISDIGAMGGTPLYAFVSLGLKSDSKAVDIESMYRGFLAELAPFDASIVGGNLTKTAEATFIDITLVGEVEEGKMVRRSTASIGDVILVTGYPGRSAAGLQLLLKGGRERDLLDHPLVRAYNTPSHRAREGRAIARTGCATGMIDTSDGFLGDLGHICEESGVGAELIKEKLPVDDDVRMVASELRKDPYELILGDSDDYELIVTCRPNHVDGIREAVSAVSDVTVTEVGAITAEGKMKLVGPDGTSRSVIPAGWDHFR